MHPTIKTCKSCLSFPSENEASTNETNGAVLRFIEKKIKNNQIEKPEVINFTKHEKSKQKETR